MPLLTREEIDQPYKDFVDHMRVTSEGYAISIGEINVLIQAKGGNLFELFRRGILIQHPTKLSHFRLSP
jgi:hypothetical protein